MCIVEDLLCVPVSDREKRGPHCHCSQCSWKITGYKQIKVVWLSPRPGMGRGETEVKVAQLLPSGNLQFSWEIVLWKLGEETKTAFSLGGE